MYKGILIYKKEDTIRNQFFIDSLILALREFNLDCELMIYEELDNTVLLDDIVGDVDFVINRTREIWISELAEKLDTPVFNNSIVTRLGNDKREGIKYMRNLGIPVMETWDEEPENFPYIEKSVDGHGGTEVFLIENEEEKKESSKKMAGKTVIYQQLANNPGRDLRVYILGNKILASVLRTNDEDFKSNFSLGGCASLHELTIEEHSLVKKITTTLELDYAGIDFIYHDGKAVFNELEDMVGARMLYQLTDIDVARCYAEYIHKKLS